MNTLLQLERAGVRFGAIEALAEVSLQVKAGERLALVGANGSGKSTLLRLLHRCQPVSAGVLRADPAARHAMVFQRPFMLRASALSNVALGLWLQGRSWSAARQRALAALDRVGLQAMARQSARSLSVGQQQRLALGRAWAMQPDLLFLDEPTASLDPHAKREVEDLIDDFAREGTTLVFASHNLGQVKRLATRVIYLEQGRVWADLPVGQFFDREAIARLSPRADAFLRGEFT